MRSPLLLLLLPLALQAQTPALQTTGAFFALSVADVDASATWYRNTLGLEVIFEAGGGDAPTVKVLSAGGLTVELVQLPAAVPLREAAPQTSGPLDIHGIFKVGVWVENYDQALATLRERGADIVIGPFPARDGQPANVVIRDNAGNMIQIFGN